MIDQEIITTVNQTSKVMLEATVRLANMIRKIKQESDMTPEPVMKSVARELQNIVNDLAKQWDALDLTIVAHDLTDVGGV